MGATHIHDLALILADLERSGRLARVSSSVDLSHDLAGLAAELEGSPRAVLFENIQGHDYPVLTGLYWSRELLADLMRREEKALPGYVADCIKSWQQDPVDPVIVDDGPVLEVTEPDVDLTRMPIPIHAEKDGGPYFDAGVVIAKDPESGVRNASIQRFQVVAKDRLHVNIDAGRHLGLYLEKAARKNSTLTFTLNCGVGPGLHFAASAPAEAAPADSDELGIASAFHGAPLELVRASNGHDDIVAHAMWALECEIVPGEVADEGPFAEVTGYYATVAPRPVVHVRKIHRRASPVFHTILSGVEVWNSVGLLGEANILQLMQKQVPGITDVYMTHGGGGFYHCVVQIAQKRQGWSKQAILAAFAAFPPLKMVTVVDDDVNLRSAQDVEWAIATRLNPKKDIVTIDESFGHGLNPSFPDYLGPKVGFDATKPYPATWAYERATYKPMTLEAVEMVQPEIKRQAVATTTATSGVSRADVDAIEAALARPQPADLTPVNAATRNVATPGAARPDGDLARPQPADLTPVRASAGTAPVAHDADAWIARPAPIDLSPRHAPTAPQATSSIAQPAAPNTDPDAWIARPAAIDLTPRRAAAPAATAQDEDPDAWIARPQAIDLSPVQSGGTKEEAPVAAVQDDPDAWFTRPSAIDLGASNATPAASESGAMTDPDAWIARPAPVDLTPVQHRVSAQETRGPSPEPAAVPATPEDPDAWIARPSAADLTPVKATPAASLSVERPHQSNAPQAEDPDAWIARPASVDLTSIQGPAPQPAPEPGPESEPAQIAAAFDKASDEGKESDSAAPDIRPVNAEEPVALVAAKTTEAADPAPTVEPEPATIADTPDPVVSRPADVTPRARPTASSEPPTTRPSRTLPKSPPKRKVSRASVSGGSFFEPAPDSAGDNTGGDGSGVSEAAEETPSKLVAATRTNRDELPRKIQPVGLPVSDTGEVVRPSGFFDSTPMPSKPVRRIARSIAKAAGSPKLKNVIKPPKSGGFFSDDD